MTIEKIMIQINSAIKEYLVNAFQQLHASLYPDLVKAVLLMGVIRYLAQLFSFKKQNDLFAAGYAIIIIYSTYFIPSLAIGDNISLQILQGALLNLILHIGLLKLIYQESWSKSILFLIVLYFIKYGISFVIGLAQFYLLHSAGRL